MARTDPLGSTADHRRIQAIVKTVEEYRIEESSAWPYLEGLSDRTSVDGIDVDPAGVILKGSKFRGMCNVYVHLVYRTPPEDGFETSDGFPGLFKGHFEDGNRPVIDELEVDTSSFFD